MTLNTPRGFSGGPNADIDWGMMTARAAWVEEAAHLLVTQPATGTRSVSIAAGYSDGFGVRVLNDAAISQAIAAPNSGSAWYMIALRRDWSAKTVTLQVLPGPTSGGTTGPTTVPTTLPATFQNTPGTQVDQPLAWVWVSSASTTMAVVDVRCQDTRGRGLQVPNLHALAVLALTALQAGSGIAPRVTVGPHNVGEQVQAIEAIGNGFGAFVLTGRIFTGAPFSIITGGAQIKTQLLAYQAAGLIYGASPSQSAEGFWFVDTSINFQPEYVWNGADWDFRAAYIEAGNGYQGGITFPGTIVNWSTGNIDCRAHRAGKIITLHVGVNVGSNGVAQGGSVLALPPGFRPQRTVPFLATLFDQGGLGWSGPAGNFTVESGGGMYYQGTTGGGTSISANKGIFGSVSYRAA